MRWFFLAGSLLCSLSGVARAQDAPTDAPPPATEPPTPVGSSPDQSLGSAAAPSDTPTPPTPATPSAPPAPAAETPQAPESTALDAPAAVPAASSEPGHAAFAPLPEAPRDPKPKRTHATRAHEAAPGATSAPTSPPAPSDPPKSNDSNDEEPWGGPFAPFRLGVLVGGGLPEILSLGAQLKVTRYFGAGVNIGLIPTIHISYYGDAKIAYQEYDAYGHLYPFGGGFFVGAGVGYASIKGNLATRYNLPADLVSQAKTIYGIDVGNPLTINSDASVRTLVLTPQLGFLHVFDVGFAIGIDVGAQIPIAPSEVHFSTVAPQIPAGPLRTQLQTTYINPNDEKVRSTLDKIGRTPLPTFNVKIGWFL